MKQVSAISLDIDNTLWDRDRGAAIVYQQWLSESNCSLSLAIIQERDQHGHAPREPFFNWLSNELKIGNPTQLWQQFKNEIVNTIKPNPSLIIALKQLKKANIPLYILSDGGSALQREKLSRLEITPYIDHLFISAETGFSKPSPAAFQQVINHCNLPAENILHCGDHWQKDILSAHQSGMQTCAIIAEHQAELLDTDLYCQHLLPELNLLPHLLTSLLPLHS